MHVLAQKCTFLKERKIVGLPLPYGRRLYWHQVLSHTKRKRFFFFLGGGGVVDLKLDSGGKLYNSPFKTELSY